MASRKGAPRRASGKGAKPKTKAELKQLLKKAQAEVDKLLEAADAAILTRFKAGLREIKKELKEIEPFDGGP
jgi:hypothetical protein